MACATIFKATGREADDEVVARRRRAAEPLVGEQVLRGLFVYPHQTQ